MVRMILYLFFLFVQLSVLRGLTLRFVTLLLLLSVFLGGCADILRRDADPDGREVQALFDQQYVDPLNRFLKKYAKDPERIDHLAQVRKELDRRCGKIAERYETRSATPANLDKLKRGYGYSCPQVVDRFTTRVAESGGPGETVATHAVESEAPQTKPELVAQVPPRADAKTAENCYLLFGIKSYPEAQVACEASARQGDARSQYNLGIISSTLNDDAAALKWIRLAVDQGLPEAQLYLGLMYGQGVDRDDHKALLWFQQAGKQGVAEAQHRAGLSYYRGEGTLRDYGRALQWFGRAAEQGYAAAQAHLGEMYAMGKGVKVDGERAENWLKRAAEHGVADAQYRLGALYFEGKIIPRDETEAYVWLSVAALAGNHEAETLRNQLAQALAPALVEKTQQRIRRIVEQRH